MASNLDQIDKQKLTNIEPKQSHQNIEQTYQIKNMKNG